LINIKKFIQFWLKIELLTQDGKDGQIPLKNVPFTYTSKSFLRKKNCHMLEPIAVFQISKLNIELDSNK
jgi:hypothetical protein